MNQLNIFLDNAGFHAITKHSHLKVWTVPQFRTELVEAIMDSAPSPNTIYFRNKGITQSKTSTEYEGHSDYTRSPQSKLLRISL